MEGATPLRFTTNGSINQVTGNRARLAASHLLYLGNVETALQPFFFFYDGKLA